MKGATVALVVSSSLEGGIEPQLLEVLSDDQEILLLEQKCQEQSCEEEVAHPLEAVHQFRQGRIKEEEEFADYVEQLLSQPFVRPEIQDHGVQWLRSRIRIQEFQRHEAEAAKVIADYALKIYLADPANLDFMLAGPKASVRVKVFVVNAPQQLSLAG